MSHEARLPFPRRSEVPAISRRTRLAAAAMVLTLVLLVTVDMMGARGILAQGGNIAVVIVSIIPLAMAALILPGARALASDGTTRLQWTLFGLGLLSVGVGNIIFIALYVATGEDPYPSIAEVFTLAMYACFGAAFYLAIVSYRNVVSLRFPLVLSFAIASVILMLVGITVVGPYVIFAPTETQPLVTRIFNTMYPILDAYILIMPAVALGMLVSRLNAGRFGWPWWLVIASATMLAVSDTVFAYSGYIGAGRTPIVDAGYAIAPMLLGLAVLVAQDLYRE